MRKGLLFAAIVMASHMGPVLAAPAPGASQIEIDLLGKDPGKGNAYACFARHYDAAHLSAHPHQNVRDMTAFVSSRYDADVGRSSEFTLGVGFKGLTHDIDIDGTCSTDVDGKKLFDCGIDCDGGHFSVTTNGRQSIVISIPDEVKMWDPTDTSDNDDGPDGADLPKQAVMGSDDKSFLLERVALDECKPMMSDEAKHDLYGTPLPPEDTGASDPAPAAPVSK